MEGETKVTKIKSVRCPYNSSHVMTLDKLGSHILKCSFRTNEFVSCKYNTLHIYRQGFIEEHERKCEDRVDSEDGEEWANIGKQVQEENQKRRVQTEQKKTKGVQNPTPQHQQEQQDFKGPSVGQKWREKKGLNKTQGFLEDGFNNDTPNGNTTTISNSGGKSSKANQSKIDEF